MLELVQVCGHVDVHKKTFVLSDLRYFAAIYFGYCLVTRMLTFVSATQLYKALCSLTASLVAIISPLQRTLQFSAQSPRQPMRQIKHF